MAAAGLWQTLVHGGSSSIVDVCTWWTLVHGERLYMVAARPWRPLVHGGCSSMAAACAWRPLVHGSRSSMAAACPWWPLVHGGRSSMRNCVILKGNSSCDLYDKNLVISNHSHIGGAILPRSIFHYATKHFAFCQEAFCILQQSISYGFPTEQ